MNEEQMNTAAPVEEKSAGLWEAIKKALKYIKQSAQGKYSLESYLEILGRFTDSQIDEALDCGEMYGGGEVTWSVSKDEPSFQVDVEMKFYSPSEKKTKTEKASVTYEIKAPRRE